MSSRTSSDKGEKNYSVKNDVKVDNQDNKLKGSTEIVNPNYYDYFFEAFRQNIQNMTNFMERSW